jgi:flagellar protein FlgJ
VLVRCRQKYWCSDMTDPVRIPMPVPKMPQRMNDSAAKLAREFEGVFAGQVTKIMMESAETRGEFTGGAGESMFRGIMAEQIGNQIAEGRGLGIRPAVETQIRQLQGGPK